jgi:hypothetical protein
MDEICDRLSNGEPLEEICRDGHMPSSETVRQWQNRDDAFAKRVATAREVGFDAIAAEALRIADTPHLGKRVEFDQAGNKVRVIVEDMLGHRRLRVDARLKLLAKWDPKRYGERVQHANDPDNPMPGTGVIVVPAKDCND